MLAEIEKLSIPEKIRLVEEIWDSIAATPKEVPVPQWQLDELERRVEAYRQNPQEGVSWEQVKAQMKKE